MVIQGCMCTWGGHHVLPRSFVSIISCLSIDGNVENKVSDQVIDSGGIYFVKTCYPCLKCTFKKTWEGCKSFKSGRTY